MAFNAMAPNPFKEYSDEKLAEEISKLIAYGNLSDSAKFLLDAVHLRLWRAPVPLKDGDTSSGREIFDKRVVGINLAEYKGGDVYKLHLVNLVKELVFGFVLHVPDAACDRLVNEIVSGIETQISPERLSISQVFVELKRMAATGIIPMSPWRAFVDLPHATMKGVLIRHCITPNRYYAFPVILINRDPNVVPVPYSTIPPSWLQHETFQVCAVNFDEKSVTFGFLQLGSTEMGAYICQMDGTVVKRYEPGTVPESVKFE